MNVLRLGLPILATANLAGLEEEALVARVRAALERALDEVGLSGVEVGYDGEAECFSLVRFIEVAGEGEARTGVLPLETARELDPEVRPGEELGFDLFDLEDGRAARIGVPVDVLHRARRVVVQIVEMS